MLAVGKLNQKRLKYTRLMQISKFLTQFFTAQINKLHLIAPTTNTLILGNGLFTNQIIILQPTKIILMNSKIIISTMQGTHQLN